MPPQNNSRNTIIFFVLAAIMVTLYSVFVIGPQRKAEETRRAAVQERGRGQG